MDTITTSAIEKVLDERIRPELALHGGNICVVKLEENVLHVHMTGNCSNCPSAELTLENIVNATLTETFPDLKRVVLVTGVSDEIISDMRNILEMRHGS